MPRLKLDPLSPSGVSPVAEVTTVKQSNGYVTNNIRGLITAGNNVTLTGSGTESNPYQIAAGDMDTAATWGNITGTLTDQTDLTTALGNYVLKAGDTMTGTLTISAGNSSLAVTNTSASGVANAVFNASSRSYSLGSRGSSATYPNTFYIYDATASLYRLVMDTSGNIQLGGSGSNSPTHTLTLPSTATGIALYNTSDQTTNYERVRQYWNSNVWTLVSENGGTGVRRPLFIGGASAMGISLNDSGGGAPNTGKISLIVPSTGSTFPIGAVANVSASSGIQYGFSVAPTINQSSTAGYTALLINPTETATGSGTKLLIDAQVGGVSKFNVLSSGTTTIAGLLIGNAISPASSTVPVVGINRPATNTLGLYTASTMQMSIDPSGTIFIANDSTVPSSDPVGGGYMYVEAGALKYRGSSGTITTVAVA